MSTQLELTTNASVSEFISTTMQLSWLFILSLLLVTPMINKACLIDDRIEIAWIVSMAYTQHTDANIKPNIHVAIWSHTI